MKGRAQMLVIAASSADAIIIRDRIIAWLASHPRFADDIPPRGKQIDGVWYGIVHCRFDSYQDAVLLADTVKTEWTTGPQAARYQPGSKVQVHVCRHDEAGNPAPCTTDFEYVKA